MMPFSFVKQSRLLYLALALVLLNFVGAQGVVDFDAVTRGPADYNRYNTVVETLEEKVERLRRELAVAEEALRNSKAGSVDEAPTIIANRVTGDALFTNAIVTIEGPNTTGVGFIATMQDRVFLVTNTSVLACSRYREIVTLSGDLVKLEPQVFVSQKRDLVIAPVEWDQPAFRLSPSLRFDEVELDDAVTVLATHLKKQTLVKLKGKVSAMRELVVEVASQKYSAGNRGAPILHNDLDLVIGVASILKHYSPDQVWEARDIRRVGYRIDGDISWQRVSLSDLCIEGNAFFEFERRTASMWNVAFTLNHEAELLMSYREDEFIGHLYENFDQNYQWGQGSATAHEMRLLRRFINSMITEVQRDLDDVDEALTLNFYREKMRYLRGYRNLSREHLLSVLKKTQ